MLLQTVSNIQQEKPKAAIVLTLVNAEKTLESFIAYHLSIGFSHIYLFFDKKEEESIKIARKYAQVTIIVNDQHLQKAWKACPLYEQLRHKLHYQEARQLLNVEVAIQLALEKGITYLLHIDADELFYSPRESVDEHFSRLTAEGIYLITYVNYEAVSSTMDIEDYFKEVMLFKRNKCHLTLAQQEKLADYDGEKWNVAFLAYNNGKSAAKLEKELSPYGVHRFVYRKGNIGYPKKQKDYFSKKIDSEENMEELVFPVILHYAECGFSHFWKKYQTRGNFPDTFLGGQRIIDTIPFQIQAREIIKKGDMNLAKQFYQQKVMLPEQNPPRLLSEKLIIEIPFPSTLLELH